MAQRIDYTKVAPGALRAMYGLEKYLGESSVEPSLRELIKLGASQINGCAYCIALTNREKLRGRIFLARTGLIL